MDTVPDVTKENREHILTFISTNAGLTWSCIYGGWFLMLADRVRMRYSQVGSIPGPTTLIGGDMTEGFFGEVTSAELITGDALASEVGISAGTSQNSTAGWLKFALDDKILFVAKKAYKIYH